MSSKACPCSHLRRRQPALRHQVGQVLRDDLPRRGSDHRHRLDGHVPQPPHELSEDRGTFTTHDAVAAYHRHLLGTSTEHVHELGYYDRKRIHNLKYYTWVEQQARRTTRSRPSGTTRLLDRYPGPCDPVDRLIKEFNNLTRPGLMPGGRSVNYRIVYNDAARERTDMTTATPHQTADRR